MTTDNEALEKVSGTFDRLDRDKDRLRRQFYPASGSALASDDEETSPLILSQHIWVCLGAISDHLDLIRLTIEDKRTFTSANSSVARGALLGACQAVWLSAPDDAELRRARCRQFSREYLVRRIEWQEEFTPDLPTAEDAARSGSQLKRFYDDLAALETLGTKRLNSTAIVKAAASAVFPNQALQTRDLLREWRRLSGSAHVLGWSLMIESTEWGPAEKGTERREAFVTGSLGNLANAYLGAWLVYRWAWNRTFDLAELSFD